LIVKCFIKKMTPLSNWRRFLTNWSYLKN